MANDFLKIKKAVYEKGQLFGVDQKLAENPFLRKNYRKNSIAVVGGALGDEGKGRITDELTSLFLKEQKQVFHYRDNGGANAGHTIAFGNKKIALHQLGSGILQKGCTVVLGKEMVLHPQDLVLELLEVKKVLDGQDIPAKLLIDEMALLCLDTHRAFEAVLKMKAEGSKAATGRGISPAYADVLYRNPVRMRDLMAKDWQKRLQNHYEHYTMLCLGFGFDVSEVKVPRLDGSMVLVGSFKEFAKNLLKTKKVLEPFIKDVTSIIAKTWESDVPMVFEKAQALGIDPRYGVYPDITASNCAFDGIYSSTEGVVDDRQIAVKAATIKATYTSSVGTRNLPTAMEKSLAERIREDANEYGATTKRPRDVVYIDLPMLSYLFRVARVEHLTLTHLDIAYPEVPIKVCLAYEIDGKEVGYRPDQEYLNKVTAKYVELPSYDGAALANVKKMSDLPKEALQYLAFLSQCLNVKLLMVSVGPKRDQTIKYY
jgi:adenylosuccinate synthase